MGHTFGTFVLAVAAAFCLMTTYTAGTAPAAFAERLGLAVANAGGRNEVRAQYAGFFLAVAAICIAALAGAVPRAAAYAVLAVVFFGLFAGRIAGLGLNGGTAGYPPTIRALLAIDTLGSALTAAALLLDRAA